MKEAARLTADSPQKGRSVFIAYGAEEEKDITESAQEMAKAIQKHSGIELELRSLRSIDGENHFSGLAANYSRGLRSLYGRKRIVVPNSNQ